MKTWTPSARRLAVHVGVDEGPLRVSVPEHGCDGTVRVPAINNCRDFGRWAFIEIDDPWHAQKIIRTFLASPPR